MTVTNIPFEMNRKSGILKVCYKVNRNIAESGFDLFAGGGFDVKMCIGYPTMRACISSYKSRLFHVRREIATRLNRFEKHSNLAFGLPLA